MRLWRLVETWPSAEQRRQEVLPYLWAHLERDPLSPDQGVPYAPWFEAMLYRAMYLEAYGDPELARLTYQRCATFKPWCPPVVMGLERLRWFSSEPDEHLGSYQWWNLQETLWSRKAYQPNQERLFEGVSQLVHEPRTDSYLGKRHGSINKSDVVDSLAWDEGSHQNTLYPAILDIICWFSILLPKSQEQAHGALILALLTSFLSMVHIGTPVEDISDGLFAFFETGTAPAPPFFCVGWLHEYETGWPIDCGASDTESVLVRQKSLGFLVLQALVGVTPVLARRHEVAIPEFEVCAEFLGSLLVVHTLAMENVSF